MKQVSVIIPVYNRVDYIRRTIESVLEQDYPAIELIVIDDGSNDGSYELVAEMARDRGFVHLTHPDRTNRGQSASINLGLETCRGDYIAILDSDDLFLPGKITKQVAFLDEHPEVGLVYGKGQAVDGEGRFLYEMLDDDHVETNDPNAMLLDCYFLLPQNSLVRREVYDRVGGFDESLRSGQDHDMLIRMAEVTTFAFQPELVFQYRRHADSISVKGLETRWRAAMVIRRKAMARYPYRRSTLRKRLAVINFRLANAFFLYKRNRIEGVFRLIYAGLLDPARALRVLVGLEKPS